MNGRVAWIGLGVAAAFGVGMMVERWTASAEQAIAAESALAGELRGIRGLLERIAKQAEGGGGLGQVPEPLLKAPVRLVEGLLEHASGGSSATQAKDPAVDKALRELYDQILEEGRLTRDALRSIGAVSLTELRTARPTADHAALGQFAELYRQDADMTAKAMKLSTLQDLVARFGMPDDVWTTDKGFTVQYDKPGTGDKWIEFWIAHGLVIRASCRTE